MAHLDKPNPAGSIVSISQDTPGTTNGVAINDMALALKGIFNLLKDSLTIDPTTGRLRVAITSSSGQTDTLQTVSVVSTINTISTGSLSTVSTVATVSNITSLGNYDAGKTLVFANEYQSWATCVRANIT